MASQLVLTCGPNGPQYAVTIAPISDCLWLVLTADGQLLTKPATALTVLSGENSNESLIDYITFDAPTREFAATAARHADYRAKLVRRGVIKRPPGMDPSFEINRPRPF